ncbi:zf-HC2 domain-containing protein [Streptomyces sp. P9(2023)]|uniref:zf-HC2 domain-containing protein n=1 Tax=Streptomyces sp. P9(2023) TaxID=3064394 RepID=UPI0028F44A2F|nr:zf-HC2 domain-containing protein [Streptomyces sp. P9(2023)]MDT9688118.1 zf-HC2 domain-containing protein [Streptomyces sp. P9(2023)]
MTATGSPAPARNPRESPASTPTPTSESGPRMTELSPPVTPVPTRHLPAHWVQAYARGELSPELLGHAEAHLDRCRPCVDAVDLAVRGGPHGPRLDALHAALVNRIG